MKTKKSDGQVKITFNKIEDKLKVTILDNGAGFNTSNSEKTHKSYGMNITNKRLTGVNNSEQIRIIREGDWTKIELIINVS